MEVIDFTANCYMPAVRKWGKYEWNAGLLHGIMERKIEF